MSNQSPNLETIGHISNELMKRKDISAVSKLIVYFLSQSTNLTNDGGIKTTIATIADGIGEETRNVKTHIKLLKDKNILSVKAGRYPVFYFKDSMVRHSVPLKDSMVRHSVPLKTATLLNNVVVVLLQKYGFNFGPVIIEKLSRFPVDDQINAIESTKAHATKNPSRYIEKILDNDCRGIRLPDNEKPSQKNACITDEYNEYCGVKVKYLDKIYVIGDAGELVTDSGTHPFFKVKQYIENKVVEVIN